MSNNPLLIAEFLYERYGEVLFDMFAEHYVEPSKDWLHDHYEDKKQFEYYKDKRKQSLDRNAQISRGREIHRRLFQQGLLRKGAEVRLTEPCLTLEKYMFGCLPEQLGNAKSKDLEELTPPEEEYFINRFILSVGLIGAARNLEESLKNNIYFPENIQKQMGFLFDFQRLNKWDKCHIKWQAAAQVLWWEDVKSSVETVKQKLLRNPQLFELLELETLSSTNTTPDEYEQKAPSFRVLGDVITVVKPKDGCYFKFIPSVYDRTSNKLHGQALYITISTMAKVLKNLGHSIEDIMYHEIFCHYALSEPLYPTIYSWLTSSL